MTDRKVKDGSVFLALPVATEGFGNAMAHLVQPDADKGTPLSDEYLCFEVSGVGEEQRVKCVAGMINGKSKRLLKASRDVALRYLLTVLTGGSAFTCAPFVGLNHAL